MKKKLTAFLLALMMLTQVLVPGSAWAMKESKSYPETDSNLVQVGIIGAENYPKLTNKVILDIQKEATLNSRKNMQNKTGVVPFNTPYLPGQEIPDKDKPKIVGNVSANFTTIGLDGGNFDWEGVFGKDSNGKPGKAKLVFKQWLNNKETGISYQLEVNKDGKYSWNDWEGKPARIPLYSQSLEAYTYSVYLDQDVSDKVKLLTYRIAGAPSSPGFHKDPETGLNTADIVIDLSIQQVASTKFVSEWHTGLATDSRPPVEGEFDNKIDKYPGYFPFSKEDGGSIIIRNDFINNSDYEDPGYSEYGSSSLLKTPEVKVTEGIEFADENDEEGSPTYIFDETNIIIQTLDKQHKFKYDLKYDVINGGKLVMTEIIPLTFDANGGKFASITEAGAEQKIVKEVEYEKDLTEEVEKPKKERETFKGWATEAKGKALSDEEFNKAIKNIKAAKTFYAIWDNNDIQVEELEVKESFKDGTGYVNDFIPSLDTLKKQVKIKDANGIPQALADTDTFEILNDSGTAITGDALKDYIYGKLQEKDNPNDEPTRVETVKAKVTHKNGTSQTVEIPIKVIKNIYEAKTEEGKPVYVPTGYVKVTVAPTTKAKDPQKYFYYVNPEAKVVIPGTDPTGTDGNVFTKWLIKGTTDEYKLADKPRHMFTAETTIEAQYEKEKQGIINIKYVDENGNKIDAKYHKDGVDYPETKEGKLADYAIEVDFPKPGPVFKGYIYSTREAIKGKKYKDPAGSDKLDTVTYKYNKKVTTDDKSDFASEAMYFPVIFDANGGKFGSSTETQKTVYVYFTEAEPDIAGITFADAKKEVGLDQEANLPTKDGENFKEWQDKAQNGTKVDDSRVLKFEGWDNGSHKKQIFYAAYGKASAKIAYLDLDGKPIGDDFKIDGVDYPEEKSGTAGEAIANDVYTKDNAPKLIGYKFNRIELNPKDGKYALDKKATIKIYYEKLPDVIPEKDGSGNSNEKPDGYVEVKFVPTDKAKDQTAKIFYVNPKKDVTIPIENPEAIATYTFIEWKMGANADGAVYKPSTAQRFTETTVITATYEETKNIIPYDPSVPDPMVRLEGYVRVTFAADPGLKLTEQKAYYVKKNAGITLGNAELVKPAYEAQTGYKFDKWDKEDSLVIEAADILVTAKATKLDNVIPEKDENGKTNDKPEGYKEVTFVVKTGDEAKGSITGVAKFYVNPTEYVTINPPVTKAETGYEFGSWDKNATIPTVYKDDTTITGSFNGLKDIIPKTNPDGTENKKPDGYKTVTFVIDPATGGKIVDNEITVYYVNPAKEVTVPQPKTNADTGYEFEKWDKDTTTATKYTEDKTVKGNFKKLEDIIPGTNDKGEKNAKPEGYVTVTFDKGDHGKEITGQRVYYVNPKADPVKTLGDTSIVKPTVKAEIGWEVDGWDTPDTTEIKSNITVKAKYKSIDDVIPKTNDDGTTNEQPKGYITVTFDKGANGELKGNTIFYVNPNKAVVLEDKAPTIKPNTGYTSAGWDTSINKAIQYKDGDKITALYNELGDVIPQEKTDGSDKPAGYLTVTFDKGTNGELSGKTVYYVKPNKEVTVPAPTVKPNTGWEQKTGDDAWDSKLTRTFTDENTTITAQYKPLDDIIPQKNTDGSDKPDGYFTVTFKSDANGTLSGTLVYYVKPNVDVDFTNTANGITKNANVGYTEKDGTWDPAIVKQQYKQDETYTFKFVKLDDVIPEINDDDSKNTQPDGYVKVTLIPTDKATDETKANKVYFVNPKEEVTITSKPTGKNETINEIEYTYVFKSWTVTRGTIASWDSENIIGTFIQDTEITAKYTVQVDQKELKPAPIAKKGVITPTRVVPKAEDLIENIPGSQNDPLPDGTKFEYTDDGTPDVENPGETTAKVKVIYPNGKTVIVEVPITVVDNVIPQEGEDKPKNVPNDFVKVTFVPTEKGTMEGAKIFWVKPNEDVKIPVKDPVGVEYNIFKEWKFGEKADGDKYDPTVAKQFTEKETIITATYIDSDNIIPFDPNPKDKDPMARPEGYVKVTFDADLGLKLTESKAYYVKKNAGITLGTLTKPKYKEASGYKFDKWDKDDSTIILDKDIVVTALAKQASSPDKPGDEPGHRPSYPEIVYRDRIVEKEKIVEKIVKIKDNQRLKEVRFMQGFEGKFRPHDGLTRAEAAQILANALKQDGYNYNPAYPINYKDVKQKWYTEAIVITTQANVFKGYDDGYFRPEEKISRAEWIATLKRFQQLQDADGNRMGLKENHWATREVEAAYEEGWLQIYTNGNAKFDANEPITREEVAAVSNRAFGRLVDKTYILRNDKSVINYKDINPSMWSYADILCASNSFIRDENYYMSHGIEYINSIVSSIDGNIIFNVQLKNFEILQDKFQRYLR